MIERSWHHARVLAAKSPIDEAAVQAAVQVIFQGTASETGARFFMALVENLAQALGTRGAWVTEFMPAERTLRALAFWLGGEWVENYEQPIDGTPCQVVVENRRVVHFPDRIIELYPEDPNIKRTGAVSYMGVPLTDLDGSILGHLAVMDTKPMPEEPIRSTVFEIFAGRAAAELRRLRAEREVRAREAQLARLIESTMDAIVQLDAELRVTQMNPAAERTFELPSEHAQGVALSRLLSAEDAAKLQELGKKLLERPAQERSTWVPGGLTGRAAGGSSFPAEATLSVFELDGQHHFTLILRNVKDRLEAERRIVSLTDEAEYLRTELRELGRSGEILGRSDKLTQVLAEVAQVGPADTTVLLFGETGTGKELFARALHEASKRRGKALIKVNCAAVPATLIESEFFGHERGAFTGATAKRDGRFTLADGGTIFLDEIGELPLELQGKLLRVLQEGEFEPVGSSRTRKVDVRVVAATNRDLQKATAEGKFREDLFYRLSVFPLTLPPLRERGDDVILLAERFARQFAARAGRTLEPLSADAAARLRAYSWPGNVRELQNVIERAVITASGGQLNLDRALPAASLAEDTSRPAVSQGAVLTAKDLASLERDNLRRALESTGWQIAGDSG
ncbi:MAG TPA: sigma 54-interacting transcriptional regulator, partial [Polyangiales bacterium]|nr:sigma 54-interacting transcriptional regulator [Polyangiales bacterium]